MRACPSPLARKVAQRGEPESHAPKDGLIATLPLLPHGLCTNSLAASGQRMPRTALATHASHTLARRRNYAACRRRQQQSRRPRRRLGVPAVGAHAAGATKLP